MHFESSNLGEYLATAFLWSLFVNVLSAFVGFWVGKKHRIQLFGSKWWKVLWGFVGVTLTVGTVVSVYLGPSFTYAIDWHVGFTLIGFGIILLETIFLSWLIGKMRTPHPRKKVLDFVKISHKRMRKKSAHVWVRLHAFISCYVTKVGRTSLPIARATNKPPLRPRSQLFPPRADAQQ